jgi:hypothetical protein
MPGAAVPVTDILSNLNDQLATAARIIGRSKHRQAIFRAVYRGKKQIKTIDEISSEVGISAVHVLVEGGKMDGLLLEKVPGGYRKKKEFSTRYKTILTLANDKKRLDRLPTKTSPKINLKGVTIRVPFPRAAHNATLVTIDRIDSFEQIGKQSRNGMHAVPEQTIKNAFAKIVGEKGSFKDWGGEKSDLYTTRIQLSGKRVAAAIAFKGKATRGKLVPAKMGKNGDQINRLFQEPADVFLVVYGGQIDSSIVSQMQAFAIGAAIGGRKVYYGVVDGTDLGRIASAYPQFF